MATVTLAHSLSPQTVAVLSLPPGSYSVNTTFSTDRTTAMRLIQAGLTTVDPADQDEIDEALEAPVTVTNPGDGTTEAGEIIGRWYVDGNRVPVDLAAIRTANRTPPVDVFRIALHAGGMILTYQWAFAGQQIPDTLLTTAQANESDDPVPVEPIFAPGGVEAEDLAAAAVEAINARREITSGIAGITSDGKLYEARIPTRLSVTNLNATYLQAATGVAGFDARVEYVVSLMRDAGFFGDGIGGGVTDHGALTGLEADDHPHYLTLGRGDVRYYTKPEIDAMGGTGGGGGGGATAYLDPADPTVLVVLPGGDGTDGGTSGPITPDSISGIEAFIRAFLNADTPTDARAAIEAGTGSGGGGGDVTSEAMNLAIAAAIADLAANTLRTTAGDDQSVESLVSFLGGALLPNASLSTDVLSNLTASLEGWAAATGRRPTLTYQLGTTPPTTGAVGTLYIGIDGTQDPMGYYLGGSYNNTAATSHQTDTIQPTTGRKLLLRLLSANGDGVSAGFPTTVTGMGVTWTQVNPDADITDGQIKTGTGVHAVALYTPVSATGLTAGVVTVNFTAACQFGWDAMEISEVEGTALQVKAATTTSANPSITLDEPVSADGILVGFYSQNSMSQTITGGSGTVVGTEVTNGLAPVARMSRQVDPSSDGQSMSWTVSGTTATAKTMILVELARRAA